MGPAKQGGEKEKAKSRWPTLDALEPEWLSHGARQKVGVRFSCPRCRGHRLAVLFANPLDGHGPVPNDPAVPGNNRGRRWTRHGDGFATLSLQPGMDCAAPGMPAGFGEDELCEYGGRSHWHGFTNSGAML